MGQIKLYLQYYLDYCHYMWRRRLIAGVLVCLAMYLCRIKSRKRRRVITYAPMIDRDVEKLSCLNRLYHGTKAHCINELRMRKAVFHRLCDELRSCALLEETFHVTIEEQVAMFIHCVGQRWSNRSIVFEFIRSSETVSRYFHLVLDALCTLARDLICIRSVETHSKITSSPGRFHPYFEGCIGALDGTHIPACAPFHMQDRFRDRKPITTQNVLAADFDLRFIYVLAGWEGLAHNSYVLQDALSRPNGLNIPEARSGVLPPYRGTRYHLQEYRGTREPESPKELFNLRHSSLRTTVERAFGTLKNRFKIFSSQPFFPLKTQVKIVMACCALHNWILQDGPDEYVYDDAT
nr:protein ALP1-like isoform X2 [Setaria viridis]